MTLLTNSAEGGTNGTGVTVGNSGGASGNAWTTVDTTSGSVTYSATGAYSGSLGYAVVTGASSTGMYWTMSTHQAAMRCYFYVTALPASGTRIMSFLNSGLSSNYCAIACSSLGVLTMINNAGGVIATSSGSISAGVWYRMELREDNTTSTAATANFDAYLGDSASAIANLSLAVTGRNDLGGGLISTAYFGKQTGSAVSTVYYDLCAMNDATTSYIGPATTSYTIAVMDDSGATEAGVLAENVDVQASDDVGLTDSLAWVKTTTTTAGPAPTPRLEIEFTPGTWTDVTADVDWGKGISPTYGRTTEFSQAKVASLTCELDDSRGKYTPKNPSSPYYPNVVPHKRVRYTLAGGVIPRFLGYIKGWPPLFENGARRVVQITALDRFDQMSRQSLRSIYQQEVLADAPVAYWPLSDSSGTQPSSFAEVSGAAIAANWTFRQNTATDTYAPGASNPMPYSDQATGVNVTSQSSSSSGSAGFYSKNGAIPRLLSLGATWECWFTMTSGFSSSFGGFTPFESPAGATSAPLGSTFPLVYMSVQPGSGTSGAVQGYVRTVGAGLVNFFANANVMDGAGHHFALTVATAGGIMTVTAYIDGQPVSTATGASIGNESFSAQYGICEAGTTGSSAVTGGLSNLALYNKALTPARILAHYQAGAGALTETTGARIARLLGYAGLSAAEMNLAPGVVSVAAQDTAGKSVVTSVQAMAVTEGGGAAVYVDTDGRVRFNDSTFRAPGQPVVILDAQGDLDGTQFVPAYDDSAIVNDSTVTRYNGAAFRFVDSASVVANGTITDSATSYAASDVQASALASDRVSRQSTPRLRIPQLVVDHITAQTGGLYASLGSITIGSRLRVINIPVTEVTPAGTFVRFPYSSIDVIVEGWSETGSMAVYPVRFDVSLADSPARMVWDDPVYGRWQADPGTCTLSSSIAGTGAFVSVVIATAAGHPTFSTSAGDYPMQIIVDDEVITLPSPPGGATSPQTFSGTMGRGQASTIAATHSAGAVVNVYPTVTWSM